MQTGKWKNGRQLISEKNGQVVRILRAPEMEALLSNIHVEDEAGGQYRKWLRNNGITTEDVQAWIKAALFTGCRFGELVVVHQDPGLFFGTSLHIPNYFGAKEKRTIPSRNVSLSYMGRKIIPGFFKAGQLPSSSKKEVNQTLTALRMILHTGAERIGLDEYHFQIQVAKGPGYLDSRGRKKKEKVPVDLVTNAVTFRSFRKTWESWLVVSFAKDYLSHLDIVTAQGHTDAVSMKFYTNVMKGFDKEDREQILPWVDGYTEVS